jgi:hypothetical protein
LGEVAGAPIGNQRAGECTQAMFRSRQRFLYRVKAGDDALDVAVDRSRPPIKCDCRDRGCGVGADPRQSLQRRRCLGEGSAMPFDQGTGTRVQIAGARVVAEALPQV